MKNAKCFLFLALYLLFFSGSLHCFPLKVKDDLGREIEVERRPQRVVSLSPSNTEILFALGLDAQIVGVTEYCSYPQAAREKAKVGGFADPDLGKIVSLNPDLILSYGLIQRPVLETIEKRGLKVFWLNPRTVKEILISVERIGKLTGTLSEARNLKQRMERRLSELKERLKDISEEKRPTLFRVMGFDPLATVGGESFQTDVFYLAGGRNLFSDIKKDYFEVQRDALLRRNPDVLVVCGEEEEGLKKRLRGHPVFGNLSAVKKDRIFVIPCDLICRPGPRIIEAIERIAGYLYPERFSDYPHRIISLGPAITESIFLLGLENRLVGVTQYCEKPPQAREKEKVGNVIDVNTEKIMTLKPDLVLATSLTNLKSVDKLKSSGIRVVKFPSPRDFEELCEQFLELGRITGRERTAERIIEAVKARVSLLKEKVNGLPKPRVFVQVGAKPLFTVTGDSFINDFIRFAGGINIARDLRSGLFSREEVLRNNPDIVIIVTMGISGEQEKETWLRYPTLKAVRENRIFIMDSYKLCSPSPVSFVETLEEMIGILHPEKRG